MKSTVKILAGIFVLTANYAFAQNLNIVFIGNSITQGVQLSNPETEAPPATTVAYLQKHKKFGRVAFSNQGHSGYTTVDFLPGGKTFAGVEEAAKSFAYQDALLIFSIKLGTNDSAVTGPNGSPVSPENYSKNIKTITDRLLAGFPGAIIIYQHPLWYSPNTYNGAKYLQEGLNRLQSYIPQLDKLVAAYAVSNPKNVFTGDTEAFRYFEKHHLAELIPENGKQGIFYLHPNKKGAETLGKFWAKAIEHCVKEAR